MLQASRALPNQPDLAQMAARIEALRRKKAALVLSNGGNLAPSSDLIPAWRPAHALVSFLLLDSLLVPAVHSASCALSGLSVDVCCNVMCS